MNNSITIPIEVSTPCAPNGKLVDQQIRAQIDCMLFDSSNPKKVRASVTFKERPFDGDRWGPTDLKAQLMEQINENIFPFYTMEKLIDVSWPE